MLDFNKGTTQSKKNRIKFEPSATKKCVVENEYCKIYLDTVSNQTFKVINGEVVPIELRELNMWKNRTRNPSNYSVNIIKDENGRDYDYIISRKEDVAADAARKAAASQTPAQPQQMTSRFTAQTVPTQTAPVAPIAPVAPVAASAPVGGGKVTTRTALPAEVSAVSRLAFEPAANQQCVVDSQFCKVYLNTATKQTFKVINGKVVPIELRELNMWKNFMKNPNNFNIEIVKEVSGVDFDVVISRATIAPSAAKSAAPTAPAAAKPAAPTAPAAAKPAAPTASAAAKPVVPNAPAAAKSVVPNAPAAAKSVVPTTPAAAKSVVPNAPAAAKSAAPTASVAAKPVVPVAAVAQPVGGGKVTTRTVSSAQVAAADRLPFEPSEKKQCVVENQYCKIYRDTVSNKTFKVIDGMVVPIELRELNMWKNHQKNPNNFDIEIVKDNKGHDFDFIITRASGTDSTAQNVTAPVAPVISAKPVAPAVPVPPQPVMAPAAPAQKSSSIGKVTTRVASAQEVSAVSRIPFEPSEKKQCVVDNQYCKVYLDTATKQTFKVIGGKVVPIELKELNLWKNHQKNPRNFNIVIVKDETGQDFDFVITKVGEPAVKPAPAEPEVREPMFIQHVPTPPQPDVSAPAAPRAVSDAGKVTQTTISAAAVAAADRLPFEPSEKKVCVVENRFCQVYHDTASNKIFKVISGMVVPSELKELNMWKNYQTIPTNFDILIVKDDKGNDFDIIITKAGEAPDGYEPGKPVDLANYRSTVVPVSQVNTAAPAKKVATTSDRLPFEPSEKKKCVVENQYCKIYLDTVSHQTFKVINNMVVPIELRELNMWKNHKKNPSAFSVQVIKDDKGQDYDYVITRLTDAATAAAPFQGSNLKSIDKLPFESGVSRKRKVNSARLTKCAICKNEFTDDQLVLIGNRNYCLNCVEALIKDKETSPIDPVEQALNDITTADQIFVTYSALTNYPYLNENNCVNVCSAARFAESIDAEATVETIEDKGAFFDDLKRFGVNKVIINNDESHIYTPDDFDSHIRTEGLASPKLYHRIINFVQKGDDGLRLKIAPVFMASSFYALSLRDDITEITAENIDEFSPLTLTVDNVNILPVFTDVSEARGVHLSFKGLYKISAELLDMDKYTHFIVNPASVAFIINKTTLEGVVASDEPVIEDTPVAEELTEAVEDTPVAEELTEVVEEIPVAEELTEVVEEALVAEELTEVVEEAPVAEKLTEVVEEIPVAEELTEAVEESPVAEELTEAVEESPVAEELTEVVEESPVAEEPTEVVEEIPVAEEPTEVVEEIPVAEELTEVVEEAPVAEVLNEAVEETPIADEVIETVEDTPVDEELTEVVEQTPVAEEPTEAVEDTPVAEEVPEIIFEPSIEDLVQSITIDDAPNAGLDFSGLLYNQRDNDIEKEAADKEITIQEQIIATNKILSDLEHEPNFSIMNILREKSEESLNKLAQMILSSSQIYAQFDANTKHIFIDSHNRGHLFSSNEFAEKSTAQYQKRGINLVVKEYNNEEITDLLYEFRRHGVSDVLVDEIANWIVIPTDTLFEGITNDDPSYRKIPVMNPELMFSMITLFQKLQFKSDYPNRKNEIASFEKRMIRELTSARYIVPLISPDRDNMKPVTINSRNGVQRILVFSDVFEMKRVFGDKLDDIVKEYKVASYKELIKKFFTIPNSVVVLNEGNLRFEFNEHNCEHINRVSNNL